MKQPITPSTKRETLQRVAIALEFFRVQQERSDPHYNPKREEGILRKLIGDLDFDGYMYLRTGETCPEGWAQGAQRMQGA